MQTAFHVGQEVRAYSQRWTPNGWQPVEDLARVIDPCVSDDPDYAGDVEIAIDGVINRVFVPPSSLEPVEPATKQKGQP